MTMAREIYSGMPGSNVELYDSYQLEAAKFIEEKIDPKATFLTGTENDNLVAAITGRNIVCGTPSYLFYHGFQTADREDDIMQMYSNPLESSTLFSKYGVDYIYIGNAEYVDMEGMPEYEQNIHSQYPCVFSNERVRIYMATRMEDLQQPAETP